jgi:hypothetical protein
MDMLINTMLFQIQIQTSNQTTQMTLTMFQTLLMTSHPAARLPCGLLLVVLSLLLSFSPPLVSSAAAKRRKELAPMRTKLTMTRVLL